MGITQKRAAPRLQGRPGQPTFYAYMDGPRRTLPGDTGDVADLCGGTPAGTRTGACAWSRDDRGPCLSFDGSTGSLSFGSPTWLVSTGPASFRAWVTVNAVPPAAHAAGVFGQSNAGSPVGLLNLDATNIGGSAFFQFEAFDGGANPFARSPTALALGVPYHLAGVRGAGKLTLYLNGVAVASASDTSGNVKGGTQVVTAGHRLDTSGGFLNSTISGLRFDPRALSAAEVYREYADPDTWTRPRNRVGAFLAGAAGPRALYHFRRRRTA